MTRITDKRDLVIFVHAAIDDYGLNPWEWRIYSRIARRAGRGDAFEAIPSMAKGCRMTESKVRDALKVLTAVGLVGRKDKSGEISTYWLTPEADWKSPEFLADTRKKSLKKAGFKKKVVTDLQGVGGYESDTTPLTDLQGVVVTDTQGGVVTDLIPEVTPHEITPIEVTPTKSKEQNFSDFELVQVAVTTPTCQSQKLGASKPTLTSEAGAVDCKVLLQESLQEKPVVVVNASQRMEDGFKRHTAPWKIIENGKPQWHPKMVDALYESSREYFQFSEGALKGQRNDPHLLKALHKMEMESSEQLPGYWVIAKKLIAVEGKPAQQPCHNGTPPRMVTRHDWKEPPEGSDEWWAVFQHTPDAVREINDVGTITVRGFLMGSHELEISIAMRKHPLATLDRWYPQIMPEARRKASLAVRLSA